LIAIRVLQPLAHLPSPTFYGALLPSARQSEYPDEALDASRIKDALNTLASALA
jgi:hypothetical protein